MLDGSELIRQLEARVRAIFQAYHDGYDASPADRFRAEGFAAALMAAGVLSATQWQEMLSSLYLDIHGQALSESEMPGRHEGVGRIPLLMQRAPVYPSTKT